MKPRSTPACSSTAATLAPRPRLPQLVQALLLLKGAALARLLERALQHELLVALYQLDHAAALLGPAERGHTG